MPTANPLPASRLTLALLAGTSLLALSPAHAQDAPAEDEDEVIYVTALKREQNLQDVPLAITALGTEQLEELHIADLEDAVKFLPSVSIQASIGSPSGPSYVQYYFRGVASGENANHSTSLPTVGTYLDEMPVTTIQGALAIHTYDLARIEALAGPQGTLYGASSMSGTVKLITNPPEPGETYGAVDFTGETVAHGGIGGTAEGFLNLALSDSAALRMVGWYQRDAGYIDNIPGSRTYVSSGIVHSNAPFVEDDYNDVETFGGRIALGIDLNDSWTVRPTLIGQVSEANGSFAQERSSAVNDELQTVQYNPEFSKDTWVQAALTIEGQIGTWDLTVAGGHLWRDADGEQDYSDYAYFYDAISGYGAFFYDNNGTLVNPNQYVNYEGQYRRMFGEVRIASPAENRLRVIAGLFGQRQTHQIEEHYIVDDISDAIQVAGTDDNIWLTRQERIDRDYAAFGELSFDLTDQLTATGGIRVYRYRNSLVGFFGLQNPGYSSNPSYACQGPPQIEGSPCTNLDKETADTDFIHKLNLTYTISPDALVYVTWSRGFRPGGINRRGTLPPYSPDKLDNYEFGWKTNFGPIRFNGAIYQLDWSGIQLSFLGANGLSEVRNAGNARIRGIEIDLGYRQGGFSLNLSGAYNDTEITEPFCRIANPAFDCTLNADLDGSGAIDQSNEFNSELAPVGTRLPLVPKFKGAAVARYEFPLFGMWDGHVQGAVSHTGQRTSDLRTLQNSIKGEFDSFTTVDVSFGADTGRYRIELFATNLFDTNGVLTTGIQCVETTCGDPDGISSTGGVLYDYVIKPRTVGLRVGFDF